MDRSRPISGTGFEKVPAVSKPLRIARPTEDRWLDDDLQIVGASDANVLVIGAEHAVTNLVSRMVPDTILSVSINCQSGPLRLPPSSSRVVAVVLRNIDALSLDEQRDLFAWLDRAGSAARVVSTAFAPLLPLVAAGEFIDALYYRLNTIYIDLSD